MLTVARGRACRARAARRSGSTPSKHAVQRPRPRRRRPRRAAPSCERYPSAVGADRAPDLVGRVGRGDELVATPRVDAHVAGVAHLRRVDADVHLGGARAAQHGDDRTGRRAAHDRVVDHHHALAAQQLGQRVELQAHRLLAARLGGLDERAPDVARLDEALAVRQPGLLRVADGGRDGRVRHGDDEIGVGRDARAPGPAPSPAAPRTGACRRSRCRGAPGRRTRTRTSARDRAWPALSGASPLRRRVIVRTSPASTSRTKRAPMASSAALSLATAHPPFGRRPSAIGRNPTGSRAATRASAVSIVKV